MNLDSNRYSRKNHIAPDKEVTNAAYPAANANLTPVDVAEITGVDLPTPPAVTDDEDDADADDHDIIEMGVVQPTTQDVQKLGEDNKFEPTNVHSEGGDNDNSDDDGEVRDDEQDEDENGEDNNSDFDDEEEITRQYPKRKRVAKAATVIDFDNKAYKTKQGIIHLNPAVFETEPPKIETKMDREEYEGMDAKDITLHIIGVIMAEQYNTV